MTDLTPTPSPAPVWPDDEMRAAIEALPVGTVVRLGHTFPETGNFQGSQYLRTRHGLRYIGPGRDDSDATTLHQQVQMCDDFRVDARPTSVLPDPTADTVLLNKVPMAYWHRLPGVCDHVESEPSGCTNAGRGEWIPLYRRAGN